MRVTVAITTVALCACGSLFGQDVMFRGNAQHSGVYDAVGVAKFGRVKWSFHTGGMVIGSPTVTGGVVYVGSDDGNFYAIDAGSGTRSGSLR
jgi:outer membrane protein assembly factor BamB